MKNMAHIDYYDFGVMVVNGKRYSRDLIITPKRILSNWWRIEGHNLHLEDLKDILNEDFEYLVIGTGYYGLMEISNDVLKEMSNREVKVIAKPTKEAVKEFNSLVKEGKKVIGAFHLTC